MPQVSGSPVLEPVVLTPPGGAGTAARSGWSGAHGDEGALLPASRYVGGDIPLHTMTPTEFSVRLLAGYLRHYQEQHGYPTTLREICHHFRRSEKTIQALLGVAVEMGLVVADQSGQHRRHRIAV